MNYSNSQLAVLATHYRTPLEDVSLNRVCDIKAYPNDILMSYFMAAAKLSREGVAEQLTNPDDLMKKLELFDPQDIELSDLPNGLGHDLTPLEVAASVGVGTDKFSYGYNGSLMIADKEQAKYEYPSGKTVNHFLLTNEFPANISILDAGYSEVESGNIFIRENFENMMLGLMDVLQYGPRFIAYQEQIADFENFIRGIVIAHELCEMEVIRSGEVVESDETMVELELTAEHHAKEFLTEQGVNPRYYELFHLLKAVSDVRGQNISQRIVDQKFTPLV